jgi:antitoxin component YwqK of YwqJK toxin-antitoxin module
VSFYKNGQIKEKGSFKNDKRDGEYIAYYKNGRVKEKATYSNGKLVGKFLSFGSDARDLETGDQEDETPLFNGDDQKEREKMVDDLLKNFKNFERGQEKS